MELVQRSLFGPGGDASPRVLGQTLRLGRLWVVSVSRTLYYNRVWTSAEQSLSHRLGDWPTKEQDAGGCKAAEASKTLSNQRGQNVEVKSRDQVTLWTAAAVQNFHGPPLQGFNRFSQLSGNYRNKHSSATLYCALQSVHHEIRGRPNISGFTLVLLNRRSQETHYDLPTPLREI